MQRIYELGRSDFWGKTYNVFAYDINADGAWHGSGSSANNKLPADSEYFISTRGASHFESLRIAILAYFGHSEFGLRQKVNVLDPFKWSTGLALAAKDHVAETAANEPARRSSIGLHGSSPATRAAEYGSWRGRLTESIVYGRYDTIGVIAELLAHDYAYINWSTRDTGSVDAHTGFFTVNTGKFHQCDQNLNFHESTVFGSVLNPRMTYTGIAHGSHSQYDKMWVFMYAEDYTTDEQFATTCTKPSTASLIQPTGGISLTASALSLAALSFFALN